jgi:hypothetical protein
MNDFNPNCRIVNVTPTEKGRQDPDFMRWMHDRLLRPPFVSAASVWDNYVRKCEAVATIAKLDLELGLDP